MNEYKVDGMTFRYKPLKEPKKSSKKESKKEPSEKSDKSKKNEELFETFVKDNNLALDYLSAKHSRTLTKFKQKYAADFMNWKWKNKLSKREPSAYQLYMAKAKADYTPKEWREGGRGLSYATFYNNEDNAKAKEKALKNCRLAPICKGKTWYEMKNNP